MISRRVTIGVAALVFCGLSAPQGRANILPGDTSSFAVLYGGTGSQHLSITNVTVNGNVGVGGTGVIRFSGPGTLNGSVDFAARKGHQFHSTNSKNVITGGETYSDANVTSDLAGLSTLSSKLGKEQGTSIKIKGTETINASSGKLDFSGNEVFDVTSYRSGSGRTLTIIGNGHDVVLNFLFGSNVNLAGDVILVGLTPDEVTWNFDESKKYKIGLNTNASTYKTLAFQGIILAPHDVLSLTNANLDGRVFGDNSGDMHIVSGTTINAPATPAAEPSSLLLLLITGLGVACFGSIFPHKAAVKAYLPPDTLRCRSAKSART